MCVAVMESPAELLGALRVLISSGPTSFVPVPVADTGRSLTFIIFLFFFVSVLGLTFFGHFLLRESIVECALSASVFILSSELIRLVMLVLYTCLLFYACHLEIYHVRVLLSFYMY